MIACFVFNELKEHFFEICIFLRNKQNFFVTNWFNPNNFQLSQNIWIIFLHIYLSKQQLCDADIWIEFTFHSKKILLHTFHLKKILSASYFFSLSHMWSNKESSHSILLPHFSQEKCLQIGSSNIFPMPSLFKFLIY